MLINRMCEFPRIEIPKQIRSFDDVKEDCLTPKPPSSTPTSRDRFPIYFSPNKERRLRNLFVLKK